MGGLKVFVATASLALAFAGCMEQTTTGGQGDQGGQRGTQRQSENLVNGLITVAAGNYNYYSFNFASGAQSPRVLGTFTASGGSGNDIKVLIMDAQAFTNWKNGHSVNTYYSSGQLTTGDIDARLPTGAGSYYLVYDNAFSTFSDKNVNTRADAEWYA